MKKPIYLLITWIFPSEGNWRGGFAYDYAKAIMRDGRYEVIVFKEGQSYSIDGIRVLGYKSLKLPSGIPFPPFWPINRILFAKALRREKIEMSDVAVVDAFTNSLVDIANVVKRKNPQAKLVTHHHDLGSFGVCVGRFRNFYPFKLINFFHMRHLQEIVDVHVFISEKSRDSFLSFPDTSWTVYEDYRRVSKGLRKFRGANIQRSVVLHNGVDTSIFKKGCNQHEDSKGKFVIGCIGNFVRLKDQITLLKALAILNDNTVQCVFVGSGPELDRCRRFAKEHNINAIFRNEVPHNQLSDIYHNFDLFVLPSYFEGFGCVFLEAWCCGVPFIASEGQGIEDMIMPKDRHLWLCRPRDSHDLATKIGYYISNRPKQSLVGETDINKLVGAFLDEL